MRKLLFLIIFLIILSCGDDNSSITEPVFLSTTPVEQITDSSVVSGGIIANPSNLKILEKGICWNTRTSPTIDDDFATQITDELNYSIEADGLTPETRYFLKAYVRLESGEVIYGDEINFITAQRQPIVHLGDLTILTEDEISEFEEKGYEIIYGTLKIGELGNPNFEIRNLAGFNSLKYVSGGLSILELKELTDIHGLENLESVGYLSVFSNDKLNNVDGFESLRTVGGNLSITRNHSLVDVSGFRNLQVVHWALIIQDNDQLDNLVGFEGLTEVDGLSISDNDILPNLNDLENLTDLGNGLKIIGNDMLSDISGLRNVSSFDGDLLIWSTILEKLDDLSRFTETRILSIRGNDNLLNIDGLANITSVTDELDIVGNAKIKDLNGLSGLRSISKTITVRYNETLTDFCGLRTLLANNDAYGTVDIRNNLYNPTIETILNGHCAE